MATSLPTKDVVPIPLKYSPSYVCNNLVYNGSQFAYAHGNEVVVVNDNAKKSSSAKSVKREPSTVTQLKFVKLNGKTYLVITSMTSVQIFDAEGSKLLFTQLLQQKNDSGIEGEITACGITSLSIEGKSSYILVGSSTGEIFNFALRKDFSVSDNIKLHRHPISDLSTDKLHSAQWCSGDFNGDIVVWRGFVPVHTFKGEGDMVTSLAVRADIVIATYSSGHIRLFSIESTRLITEICGHSQIINALSLHPGKDMFATVSDDTLLCLWSFGNYTPSNPGTVQLLSQTVISNYLLCGVQFCGALWNKIAIAAYDSTTLPVWTNIKY